MSEFGYAGKILRVDLSQKSMVDVPTSDYAESFLGGRGIAAKIYWDEVLPDVKALDPENRLIIITGPLAGLTGLAGGRWQICGKSPSAIPESFSYASLCGSWGAHLKFAGYDGIVVQGKSDKPVYLFIKDGVAEIRDAADLWGKGSIEVRGILKERHGREIRVAATGPAGDNMVPTAIVLADDEATGSSGFGAVMGSKKLKAIAVGGSGKVTVSNPERLQELRKYARDLRREAPTIYSCAYRDPIVFRNPRLKKFACYGCVSGCIRGVYQAENGNRGKFMCWGVSFYSPYVQRYYGKWNEVPFHANQLCDQYGIDLGAIDVTMRWLDNCYKAGILTDESTGIPISKLGSLEFIETLLKKMSRKEGFGEIIAQGVLKAAEIVGNGAKEQMPPIWHKNQIDQHYDPREYIITGLLYAMEPRQAMALLHEISTLLLQWVDWCKDVNNSYMSTDVFRAIAKRFFGSELAVDFSTYDGKALAVKKIQDRTFAKECLILCDFTWPIKEVKHSEDHVGDPSLESKILSAVTGKEVDEEGLYRIGEKVFNFQRAILVREGHKGREGDNLAEYNYTTPLAHGRLVSGNPSYVLPGKDGEIIFRDGVVVDRKKFEKLKDEYYQLRGWDIPTGLQTKAKLAEFGLQDVARDLEARGLVV